MTSVFLASALLIIVIASIGLMMTMLGDAFGRSAPDPRRRRDDGGFIYAPGGSEGGCAGDGGGGCS